MCVGTQTLIRPCLHPHFSVTETRSVIDAELQALVEVEFLMGLEEEELVTIGE